MCGLGGLVAEPVDPAFLALDEFLLFLVGALPLLADQRFGFEVAVVISGVRLQPTSFDFDDALHYRVQHGAVVRDDDKGVRRTGEIAFEPLARLDVEVILRFIEQQQIGLFEQHKREHEPRPLSAAQGGDFEFEVVHGEAEAVQHALGALPEVIAAARGKLVLQHAIAIEDRIVAVAERFLEAA